MDSFSPDFAQHWLAAPSNDDDMSACGRSADDAPSPSQQAALDALADRISAARVDRLTPPPSGGDTPGTIPLARHLPPGGPFFARRLTAHARGAASRPSVQTATGALIPGCDW